MKNGKCFYCGKLTELNNLIAISDGFYCSRKHGLLALIEKRESIDIIILNTIQGMGENNGK